MGSVTERVLGATQARALALHFLAVCILISRSSSGMRVKIVLDLSKSLGTVLEPYRVHTQASCSLHSGVAVIEE